MKETRVFVLARELGVQSSEIVKKCRDAGLDVRNHMASISSEVAALIRLFFTEGKNNTTSEKSPENRLGECRDCLYYLPKDGTNGLCRRHPPRVVSTPDTSECLSCWPQVRDSDGCGEFKPVESA